MKFISRLFLLAVVGMDKSTETFAGHDALCVDDPIQFGVSAAQRLLRGKRVVIMGCSVQRDLYKDLVLLLQEQRYLSKYENRVKVCPPQRIFFQAPIQHPQG